MIIVDLAAVGGCPDGRGGVLGVKTTAGACTAGAEACPTTAGACPARAEACPARAEKVSRDSQATSIVSISDAPVCTCCRGTHMRPGHESCTLSCVFTRTSSGLAVTDSELLRV